MKIYDDNKIKTDSFLRIKTTPSHMTTSNEEIIARHLKDLQETGPYAREFFLGMEELRMKHVTKQMVKKSEMNVSDIVESIVGTDSLESLFSGSELFNFVLIMNANITSTIIKEFTKKCSEASERVNELIEAEFRQLEGGLPLSSLPSKDFPWLDLKRWNDGKKELIMWFRFCALSELA